METGVVAAPSPAETVRDPPACARLAQGCQPPAARARSLRAAGCCWAQCPCLCCRVPGVAAGSDPSGPAKPGESFEGCTKKTHNNKKKRTEKPDSIAINSSFCQSYLLQLHSHLHSQQRLHGPDASRGCPGGLEVALPAMADGEGYLSGLIFPW